MTKPTKIVRLTAENTKRLRAVEIRPDGALVQITGKNGAGKSSVLDAIWMALGGRAAIPRQPVRKGAEEARIELELGDDLLVTRTIKPDGTSRLTVSTRDGARYPSPQAMLDKLVEGLSFDPLAFTRLRPVEQRELLRKLVGLDTTAIEAERAKLYDERTATNRELRRLEGELSGVPHDPDAPAELVDVAALTAELRSAEKAHRDIDRASAAVDRQGAELARAREHLEELRSEEEILVANIEELKASLAELQARIARGSKEVIPQHEETFTALRGRVEELKAEAPDREAIEARLRGAEAINAKVRANARRAELDAKHAAAAEEAKRLSKAIDDLDRRKADAIAAASYPLEGLGVDDEGVLLNGLPLEQASSAEQLRASVAIGLALHPQLRVLLVRDGSLLDEESLGLLATMAAEADAQVWLERVTDGEEVGVVIEDGAVRGAAPATEAAE